MQRREDIVAAEVERLCHQGCRRVRAVIQCLRRGGAVEGTAHLTGSERARLLRELESIMAVYDRRRGARGWGLVAAVVLWFGLMLAVTYWS